MSASREGLRQALARIACVVLAGCAAAPAAPSRGSYVALLDNPDGTAGSIEVHGAQGVTHVEKSGEATRLDGPAGNRFEVTAQDIARDFAPALDATPEPPDHFVLYFESRSARLTSKSRDELPHILAALARRSVPDVSVIGHTDTVGDDASNEVLGQQRARLAADLLAIGKRIPVNRIVLESHGEKNPRVRTADNVDEPRNRRVEVTVR